MGNKSNSNTQTKTIEIPRIEVDKITVTITGLTPLIMNKFREQAKQSIEDKQQHKAAPVKGARKPEEEWLEAIHLLPNSKYGFPAAGIMKALVAAGGRFADEKMTHLRGVLSVPGDLVEMKCSKPIMRKDFVNLRGAASIAYRPMFEKWEMDVPVYFLKLRISEGQIFNLFQIAGFSVGIGAWRKESNGTFGMFEPKDKTT